MDEIIFRKNKGASKKTCDKWAQTDKVEFSDSNRSRYNESSKLHDSHKSKEQADFDRHKRKLSPERKYSDDYHKTSHRDESGFRSKYYEGRSRKPSHENNKSKSPEKHEKKVNKHELREDDLRKTLLKNKSDEKVSFSSKESSRKAKDKRDSSSRQNKKDKYKEKDQAKEKGCSKSDKTDDKRDKNNRDHEGSKKDKVVKSSPKKVQDKGSDPKSIVPDETKSPIEIVKEDITTEITKDAPKAAIKVEEVIAGPKVEVNLEEKTSSPKSEINVEEKVTDPKIVQEEVVESKITEIVDSIPENSSSSKKNETVVDQTAQKNNNFENAELMSSTLNLSAESDTNEVSTQPVEKVNKEKIFVHEKLPEIPSNDNKPKETVLPLKIETPAPKKPKYVPIFEAKIYPHTRDVKYKTIKPERASVPKQEEKSSKSAQKFHPIDTISSNELLPITVTINKSQETVKDDMTITETITAPIIEVMQKLKGEAINIPNPQNENNPTTESPNDSFESIKENSLNNSFEKKKHKKRKITTEVEEDGTVVWTVTRKKRKTKEQN